MLFKPENKMIRFISPGHGRHPWSTPGSWIRSGWKAFPACTQKRPARNLLPTKEYVIGEYMKIGSDHLEWYDLKYWIDKFGLQVAKDDLLELYEDEIETYPEVQDALDILADNYVLVVTSNAAREFIDIELEGLQDYFHETFSVTQRLSGCEKVAPGLRSGLCSPEGQALRGSAYRRPLRL